MAANPRRANGHRRNQVRARVLAEEDDCWLCGLPVDKTLALMPHVHSPRCANRECPGCVPSPMRPEVDEIVPVSQGGDPFARANCRLAHRQASATATEATWTSTPTGRSRPALPLLA